MVIICKKCEKEFWVYPSHSKRIYCSKICFLGDKSSRKYNNSGLFKDGHIGSHKGEKWPEEVGRKISLAKTGSKHTAESKKKMSLAKKGKKRCPLSEETKKKISMANKIVYSNIEMRKALSERRLKQIFPRKQSTIELKLQNFLKEQNIEFVTHYPILGQPDIFIKPNICIFADGCYWHKCPDCGFGHGRERDVMVTKELQKQGYVVIRMWEHEIKNNDFNIKNFIS